MKLALCAGLVVALFLAASLASFWLAVRPPRLTIALRPEEFGLRVEPVRIAADDGVRLAGWLVPRPGAPAVVMLHGYPADKSDLLPLAAALAPRFTVLLMDLRYFGESQGRATTIGFRERRDLSRALDFLQSRGMATVGVFGLSLGGAVALLAAGEDPRIRAVVAYAPFADLRELGRELYAWMGVVRGPFVQAMLGWSQLAFGADISRPAPVDAAARLQIPVLLVYSRDDEQIPFRHAERLRAAVAGNPRAELLVLERGRHGELPPGFGARLGQFLGDALGARAAP